MDHDANTRPFKTWTEWTDAVRRYRQGRQFPDPRRSFAQPRRSPYLLTRTQTDHEGATFTSAWHQFTRGLEGQPVETFGEGQDARDIPFGNFQVYVPRPTSPDSGIDLLGVASALEERTFDLRHGSEEQARDRLDVYGLGPVAVAAEAEDRDQLARPVVSDSELRRDLLTSSESKLRHLQIDIESGGYGLDETARADMVARAAALQASIEAGKDELARGERMTRAIALEESIKVARKELARGDMVTRAIAHQRARMAAAVEVAVEAGHREFFWTLSPPANGGHFEQGIIVLEKLPEDDKGWERAVSLFIWFDRTDFCSEEEEPEALHEVWVEPAIGATEAAKKMHEMRCGNSNMAVEIVYPWLGTFGEPDPDPPSPPTLSRAERMQARSLGNYVSM